MKSRLALSLIVLSAFDGFTSGQTKGASQSYSFPRFTMKEGQVDSDGFPISGAKVCILGRPDLCYQMPDHKGSSGVIYQFGLDLHTERLPLVNGGSWIFFTAMFNAGGSGSLTSLAVLRYDGESDSRKIVNLLPFVGANEASDYAMWTVPEASPYPILVNANFVWDIRGGETHFEPHFYMVEAFRFDAKVDQYVKAFSYRTSRKYNSDPDPVHVLRAERAEIIRRLLL